jgi:hypothetical protein
MMHGSLNGAIFFLTSRRMHLRSGTYPSAAKVDHKLPETLAVINKILPGKPPENPGARRVTIGSRVALNSGKRLDEREFERCV